MLFGVNFVSGIKSPSVLLLKRTPSRWSYSCWSTAATNPLAESTRSSPFILVNVMLIWLWRLTRPKYLGTLLHDSKNSVSSVPTNSSLGLNATVIGSFFTLGVSGWTTQAKNNRLLTPTCGAAMPYWVMRRSSLTRVRVSGRIISSSVYGVATVCRMECPAMRILGQGHLVMAGGESASSPLRVRISTRVFIIMARVLLALFVCAIVSTCFCETNPDADTKAPIGVFLQEYKGPKGKELKDIEAKVRDSVNKFAANSSGFPTDCLRVAQAFASDAIIELPVGKNVFQNRGERYLFRACESFFLEQYEQIHHFIDGPVYVNGYTATFRRSTLLMTKGARCRFATQGYTTVLFDKEFKIKQLKDHSDVNEYLVGLKQCSFPGTFPYTIDDDTTTTNTPSADEAKENKKSAKKEKTEKQEAEKKETGKKEL
eukprot:TRINITY_DN1593_c0_g1_i1.p1 TRINITY_DN1593_c0_g1~~TRINITY_DN1593_c0_g1_i1.p1  ORF type:complete len:428 (+),score=76.30 TRINITY_DN1593_c0_g1_i1:21-1304(+)